MRPPLEGVRVLAIEQFGAGPFATNHLGDLGAEILKIEDPNSGGDNSRYVPPYTIDQDSLYFQGLNRNKRSVTLNLRTDEGREIFHGLVRVSDAVYNNLRGDLPRKLGLDYHSLQAINQRVVCCSLSGFGLTGPRHAEPGYDYLMQAYSGYMSLTGEPDALPARSGVPIIDFSGGYASLVGLMVGLFNAERTGLGCDVDISLLETAVSMLGYMAAWSLNRDFNVTRLPASAHPTMVPCQVFATLDSYVVVMCLKEKFWRVLCTKMEREDLTADPRFRLFPDRLEHRAILIPILEDIFRQHTTAEWLERLRGSVPCAPVNTIEEALRDPQLLARDMIVELEHPVYGTLRELASPIKIGGAEPSYRAMPALGADTDAILQDYLGYSPDRVAELHKKGVV